MSRKYRQSGYQDDEGQRRERPAPQQKQPPRDRMRPDRPGGRGLGAPTREVFKCAVCGARQAAPQAGRYDAECESCGTGLHTCTHCRHFDTSVRWECRSEIDERIAKKSAPNHCDLFTPRVTVEHEPEKPAAGGARAAFDDLFKGI